MSHLRSYGIGAAEARKKVNTISKTISGLPHASPPISPSYSPSPAPVSPPMLPDASPRKESAESPGILFYFIFL